MERVEKMPHIYEMHDFKSGVSYFYNKYIRFSSVCVLLCVKCLRFRRAIRCCFWPDLYKVSALPVLLWQVTDFVEHYIRFQKDAVKS